MMARGRQNALGGTLEVDIGHTFSRFGDYGGCQDNLANHSQLTTLAGIGWTLAMIAGSGSDVIWATTNKGNCKPTTVSIAAFYWVLDNAIDITVLIAKVAAGCRFL
jgi:hypothetical protein